MQQHNSNLPTLAERLKKAGTARTNYYPLYSLFTEDYFTGLDDLMGLPDSFSSVYQSKIKFYDPDSNIPLAEMVEKTAGFIPEAKAELLYLLLVQPFYYIAHMEERN